METNKLIAGVVSVMIAVIVLGSLLIPGLELAQSNNKFVLDNEVTDPTVTYRLDGNDDYNLTTTTATSGWLVNGSPVDMRYINGSMMITDKCRFDKSGGYVALYDDSGTRIENINGTQNLITVDYTAASKEFTVKTYSGFESDTPTNTYTYNVANILYFIPGGDYGAIVTNGDPDVSYIVNDPSQAIAGGAYTTGDLDTSYFCEGRTIYVGNASYTGSVEITETGYRDFTDVKSCSGFSVTIADGEDTETFTPYTVFVPLHVTGHTKAQDNYNMLYGVIPVFIVIAILVAAAVMFIRRE